MMKGIIGDISIQAKVISIIKLLQANLLNKNPRVNSSSIRKL